MTGFRELTEEELKVLAQKPESEVTFVTTDEADEKDADRVVL